MRFGFGLDIPSIAARGGKGAVTPENFMADSEAFNVATYWAQNAGIVYTGGQTDPVGGSDAILMTIHTTPTAFPQTTAKTNNYPATLGDTIYCCSMYYKWLNQNAAYSSVLRFYNVTSAAHPMPYCGINWDGLGGAAYAGHTLADGGGLIDIGSGWYRLYMHFLVPASMNGHEWRFQIYPWANNQAPGEGVYVFGTQVENGRTTPGPYLSKPV